MHKITLSCLGDQYFTMAPGNPLENGMIRRVNVMLGQFVLVQGLRISLGSPSLEYR